MIKNFSKIKNGFTLVEVLVYLAILIMVSVAAVTLLLSLSDLFSRYQVETALYRSGSNVLEQILVEIRRSEQLDPGTVIDDAATGKLVLINGATTTEFAKVGDDLELTINGVNYGNLLTDEVILNGFTVFRHDTALGSLVRVRLDLTGSTTAVSKDLSLYGGAVIRGDL